MNTLTLYNEKLPLSSQESFSFNFNSLPLELRLRIWELCLSPRVVDVRTPNYGGWYSLAISPQSGNVLPPLPLICREALSIFRSSSYIYIAQTQTESAVHFDPGRDMLFLALEAFEWMIDIESWMPGSATNNLRDILTSSERSGRSFRFEHLAITFFAWRKHIMNQEEWKLPTLFRDLKTLCICYSMDGVYDYPRSSDAFLDSHRLEEFERTR